MDISSLNDLIFWGSDQACSALSWAGARALVQYSCFDADHRHLLGIVFWVVVISSVLSIVFPSAANMTKREMKDAIAEGILKGASGALEKRSVRLRDTKVCPMCAETIKMDAKICRFCGHQFGANGLPITSEKPETSVTVQQQTISAEPIDVQLANAESEAITLLPAGNQSTVRMRRRSMGVAYLLLLILGGLGIHNFYIGRWKLGAVELIMGIGSAALISSTSWVGVLLLMLLLILLLSDLFTIPRGIRKYRQTHAAKL